MQKGALIWEMYQLCSNALTALNFAHCVKSPLIKKWNYRCWHHRKKIPSNSFYKEFGPLALMKQYLQCLLISECSWSKESVSKILLTFFQNLISDAHTERTFVWYLSTKWWIKMIIFWNLICGVFQNISFSCWKQVFCLFVCFWWKCTKVNTLLQNVRCKPDYPQQSNRSLQFWIKNNDCKITLPEHKTQCQLLAVKKS